MNVKTLTNLIISYLNSQQYSLFSDVEVVQTLDKGLDYTSLYFCYLGKDIEIQIYNSTFIKFKIKNSHGTICDSISSVRSEIEKISYYR